MCACGWVEVGGWATGVNCFMGMGMGVLLGDRINWLAEVAHHVAPVAPAHVSLASFSQLSRWAKVSWRSVV